MPSLGQDQLEARFAKAPVPRYLLGRRLSVTGSCENPDEASEVIIHLHLQRLIDLCLVCVQCYVW